MLYGEIKSRLERDVKLSNFFFQELLPLRVLPLVQENVVNGPIYPDDTLIEVRVDPDLSSEACECIFWSGIKDGKEVGGNAYSDGNSIRVSIDFKPSLEVLDLLSHEDYEALLTL